MDGRQTELVRCCCLSLSLTIRVCSSPHVVAIKNNVPCLAPEGRLFVCIALVRAAIALPSTSRQVHRATGPSAFVFSVAATNCVKCIKPAELSSLVPKVVWLLFISTGRAVWSLAVMGGGGGRNYWDEGNSA